MEMTAVEHAQKTNMNGQVGTFTLAGLTAARECADATPSPTPSSNLVTPPSHHLPLPRRPLSSYEAAAIIASSAKVSRTGAAFIRAAAEAFARAADAIRHTPR